MKNNTRTRVDFHLLNVDHISTRPLAEKYGAVGIPMIVLLDSDGAIFETLFGYQTEEQLGAALAWLVAATPTG